MPQSQEAGENEPRQALAWQGCYDVFGNHFMSMLGNRNQRLKVRFANFRTMGWIHDQKSYFI